MIKHMTNYEDIFNDNNARVPTQWEKAHPKTLSVAFSKVGDWIYGTYLGSRQIPSKQPGKENEMITVYDIKGHAGEFHKLDNFKQIVEEPIKVEEGSLWSVYGKKDINERMAEIPVGHFVAFKFLKLIPSKKAGFNPMKDIDVRNGGKDPDYSGESISDISDEAF